MLLSLTCSLVDPELDTQVVQDVKQRLISAKLRKQKMETSTDLCHTFCGATLPFVETNFPEFDPRLANSEWTEGLKDVFKTALELKFGVLLAGSLRFRWPRSDERFDSSSMDSTERESRKGALVQIPILPALVDVASHKDHEGLMKERVLFRALVVTRPIVK